MEKNEWIDKAKEFLNNPDVEAAVDKAQELTEKAAQKAKDVYESPRVQGIVDQAKSKIDSLKQKAEDYLNQPPTKEK